MGIKVRSDSIAHLFLLTKVIESYMEKNNISLLEINKADEMIIQKSYDEICDEVEKEVADQYEKAIVDACVSDIPMYGVVEKK